MNGKALRRLEPDLDEQASLFEDAVVEASPEAEPGELEPSGPDHRDGRDLLEALIFASDEALDTARLARLLERPEDEIPPLLDRLNEDYRAQGRAFEIIRLAGGWQLAARRRYAPLLRRLLKEKVRPRLSRAALETLAVVAFRQPVVKGDIEAVRGVKAEAVLRTLLERGLVMTSGRSEGVGRPLLYRTTRGFLEAFGLDSLQDLPRLKEVREWLKGSRDRGAEDLPPQPLRPISPPEPAPPETPATACAEEA